MNLFDKNYLKDWENDRHELSPKSKRKRNIFFLIILLILLIVIIRFVLMV
jgi:predicted nucleic acid-binding Zn ribbon protein